MGGSVPKSVIDGTQAPTVMFSGRHGSELRYANVAFPISLAHTPAEFADLTARIP